MSEDDIAPLASLSRADVEALMAARHPDPFAILGPHRDPAGHGTLVRAFLPGALSVRVEGYAQPDAAVALSAIAQTGLFEGAIGTDAPGVASAPYRLVIQWPGERVQETEDPYSFKTLLTDFELHLIAEGRHRELASCLGAQVKTIDGVTGLRFAVWAPNASRVSVVGDFNAWDGRRHPMRLRHSAGVWELFVPRLAPGERYKYELVSREGHLLPQKADPLARMTEHPPATASIATAAGPYAWTDEAWCTTRAKRQSLASPLSIYEVHAASWLAAVNDPVCGWARLAERLTPYACEMGFSHIELLPVMEHPFGGSWGYQPLGQFAPTARFGRPQDFARFVDACHAAGLGVILDWVPAHFPTDAHGLYQFDGSALYEYADPREGVHRDWNTAIYNFGRNEVRGFLIASALFWLEEFHIDGLRVDAVASMLYRDYSRAAGEWLPNRFGGRENLEAIAFLRELNEVVAARCPGALMIAEESTAWPGVTAALADGGLGFTYKWNMGWMHDTLRYLAHDPVHRSWHHHDMSFALVYAYSERFILPLSHDEVVHGKKSLLEKMPGDAWQRFANLRAYLGFMWGHPGKKLLFMGDEIAQPGEWNHDHEIRWDLLADPAHGGVQRLVADLNAMLNALGALFERDHLPEGFAWVVGDDARNSVYAFLRPGGGLARSPDVLVVSNFTPVPHTGYRVGVPRAGVWTERLNTDAFHYGGSNVGNAGAVTALAEPSHGHPYSLVLTLPPLATLFLVSP